LSVPIYPDCSAKTHFDSANAEVEWAGLSTEGSSAWSSSVERAVEEYKLSASFLSGEGQPIFYASVKHAIAVTTMKLASWKTRDEHLQLLQFLLSELDDGIKALDRASPIAARLYEDRAHCYRALYAYSQKPDKALLRLAREDEDKAHASNATPLQLGHVSAPASTRKGAINTSGNLLPH
jgi:hypothetical protein